MKKVSTYLATSLLLMLACGSMNSVLAEPKDSAVPGPDIIVGDIGAFGGVAQLGSAAGQVGLGMGTTSCNHGDQDFNFLQLPNGDHSVVTQNLYRMSGGPTNNDRFEQIGQSWAKHTFG